MGTPALKLPYELTAKIFSYCLPIHRRVRPDQTKASLQVAQICGHWRAIALATPELWSSVLLEFGENNCSGDDICEFFNLWFTRAVDYPLSITIFCRESSVGVPKRLLEVMDFLVFNNIRGPFPILRSLSIAVRDLTSSPPTAIRADSNLGTLHLVEGFRPMSWSEVEAMPASVTALQGMHIQSGSSFKERIRIIRHFPRLLHLGVTMDCALPINTSQRTPGAPQSRVQMFPVLFAFLSHSVRFLNQLTITLKNNVGDHFITCLSILPTLASLEFFCLKGREKAVTPRYHILKRAELFPQLQTLSISHHFYDHCYELFLAVLRARPALAHAVLRIFPGDDVAPPAPDTLNGFAVLVMQGRGIRLTTPTFSWPEGIRDPDAVGNLDYSTLGFNAMLGGMTPHVFSPFNPWTRQHLNRLEI
ncbi:hypothetical protein B0H14DRAFT_3148003 [Mycena olivaceomarginata]|nr:hypothetical protein B0H14DRAFT_3148003 [Mycena olivaceomarginata]